MSSDLKWHLIKGWNAFQRKTVPGGPILSSEPNNLLNIQSPKFSGLVNDKFLNVKEVNGAIQISTREPEAGPHGVKSSVKSHNLRRSTDSKHAAHIITRYASDGYRPDLRKFAIARASTLVKVARGPKPGLSEKPGKRTRRSKKAQRNQKAA